MFKKLKNNILNLVMLLFVEIILGYLLFTLLRFISYSNMIGMNKLAVNLIITIVFCPLFLGFILTFFKNKINSATLLFFYVFTYALGFILITHLFFIFLFYRNSFYIKIYDVICFEDFSIAFDVYFNNTTMVMLYVVFSVSFLVSIFSIWYMYGDPNSAKFLSLITFFSFFMLILVCANNLILIFVGWEGIGLFSYFLINFWQTRAAANRSALKAIAVNKIGDCFFYAFMIFYWFAYKTFNVYESSNLMPQVKDTNFFLGVNYDVIFIFLIIAASVAKSAQVTLHIWLPDAMEGPTPVSALLHAATMVTAGIYVLLKLNFLFEHNPSLYNLIINLGLITNFIASFIAIFQNDIKKIIAYSTASQIGIIYMAFGLVKFDLSIFHIFNHAYFKAFLFILAGIVIHYYRNKQDLRLFSKLNESKFFVYLCFILCCFSLMSVPFFSGYYSKEFIIQNSFVNADYIGIVPYYFINLSAVTTSIYTFKILYFLFYSKKSYVIYKRSVDYSNLKWINTEYKKKIDFLQILLSLVCFILAVFSIIGGFFASTYFLYSKLTFAKETSNSVIPVEPFYLLEHMELSGFFLFGLALVGWVAIFPFSWPRPYRGFSKNFFSKKFFFNDVYNGIVNVFIFFNYIPCDFMDKSIIERSISEKNFTISGLSSRFKYFCYLNKLLFVGYFFIYLQLFLVGFLFMNPFILIFIFFICNKISVKLYDLIVERFFGDPKDSTFNYEIPYHSFSKTANCFEEAKKITIFLTSKKPPNK